MAAAAAAAKMKIIFKATGKHHTDVYVHAQHIEEKWMIFRQNLENQAYNTILGISVYSK